MFDSPNSLVMSDCWPCVSAPDSLIRVIDTRPHHESPSLASPHPQAPAYELKYALPELAAAELEKSFSSWLSLDPHADPHHDHSYRIATVYTDTPQFDVFHRAGSYRRTKFRVRRYGNGESTFLERKSKRGRQVKKRRSEVHLSQLHRLGDFVHEWEGQAFATQLRNRNLRPVCAVSYWRRAYFGLVGEERVRATFDRDLRGVRVDDWNFPAAEAGPRLATGLVICELKFRGSMPTPFKLAVEQIQTLPGGFSKYRGCMEAHGMMRRENSADVA
jgi:SPX domain protein involved in polyphosphate accumulation